MTSLKTEVNKDHLNSHAVLVMGMHRSGTSMLTRSIKSLGVSVGREDALMITLPDQNAAGFWEVQGLTDLNDAFLKIMGGIWHAPPVTPDILPVSPPLDDLAEQARTALAQTFPSDQWVWKDPRNCVTLPFWKPLLPADPVYVYIYRNPLNVWKSLEKRDGFSKAKAYTLWEVYNYAAFRNMAGAPVFTVNFDQFLATPYPILLQIKDFLTVGGFNDLVDPGEEETRSLAALNLRHWYQAAEGFLGDDQASPSQTALFQALLESQGPSEVFQAHEIPGWPAAAHTAWQRLHHDYTAQLMTEVAALYQKVDHLEATRKVQVIQKTDALEQAVASPPGEGRGRGPSKSLQPTQTFAAPTPAAAPQPGTGISETAFFTIVSKNYLPYARVLCDSILRFHPDANLYVLLVDRLNGEFDPDQEPYKLILLDELENIPNHEHLFFKYNVLELNTAVKPYFFDHLMAEYGYQKIIYFDPDIVVFHPLDDLLDLLDVHNMVLTPHIMQHYDDDRKPSEIDINLSGIYNLGFLALRNTPPMKDFIAWWGHRLYYFCASDVSRGLFTDQRWVNFAPTMFEGVHILRDPAYNIAYWNFHARGAGIHFEHGQLFLGDQPVIFFHFSGFDPDNIEMVSKHQNRFTLSDLPNLRTLFEFYRSALLEAGHKEARTWKYALNHFDNGVRIPDIVRIAYRNMGSTALYFGNPFKTSGFANFFDWLNKDLNVSDKPETYPLSNLVAQVYALSPHLQRAFPNPIKNDNSRLLAWLKENGVNHYQIDPVFLSPSRKQKTSRSKNNKNRDRGEALPFGVNIAGYLTGEFGVGQNVRENIRAIQAAGIPHMLNNISYSVHRTQDDTFKNFSKDNPYAINLINVNADTTGIFRQTVGQEYFNNRYNIGLWWWELERFPKQWEPAFSLFQEIWTQSTFCQKSIGRRSPIPVTMIPHVVHLDEEMIEVDKARFDIPEGTFSFIFSYDFYSILERKNPFAVIDAFKQAFGDRSDAMLILKSINDHVAPDQIRLMRERAEGINIRLIKEHLSRRDMVCLLTTADCYVSLHRSEGFGQGMAEAMYVGTPVIGTGYSGNMDFMTPENSYPVDFELVELEKNFGPYEKGNVWADPDVEHAAALMQQIYTDRETAQKKAAQAAADIRHNHSAEAMGEIMLARFNAIDRATNGRSTRRPTTATGARRELDHQVDIVIPVYGKPDLLKQCVESVLETTEKAHLTLVDDCSPGKEIQALFDAWKDHPRITLLQTPSNQGFIGTTRLGASVGKAPYILFLNSDTQVVEPGWLTKLIPTDEQVAVAGAQLLYPQETPGPLAGTIQHAGVGRNAKGVPYHPFLGWPAHAPEANTPRMVNAVTGACFLVRREVWDQLEGWDPRFGKGVYEDVDFCWRARQAGYQVSYQPEVSLFHYESASRGPDGRHLLNEHTLDNLKLLLDKWGTLKSDEGLFYGEKTFARWEMARADLKRGVQLLVREDSQGALQAFRKAVKKAPDFAEAHLIIGQQLAEKEEYKVAAEYLENAIPLAPANWDARLLLVDSWIKLGEFDRAADQLEHLLAVFPDHPNLQIRKNALSPKTKGADGEPDQVEFSTTAIGTLESLLTSEDIVAALEEQEDQLDEELLQLIQVNASTARSDGDLELADGLDALTAYVNDVLTNRQAGTHSNGDPRNGSTPQEPAFEAAVPINTGPTEVTSPVGQRPRNRRRRRRKS